MSNTLTLSPVIAGCMRWGQWGAKYTTDEYGQLIHQCLEAGITSFDHADIYGHYTTEEDFGNALKKQPALRSQMQLITKCGIKMLSPNRKEHAIKSYDTSRHHILTSVEISLTNLHTDHIDLLLIHRPHPLMDPDEIAGAFTLLKDQGKVLHFGVSNFTPSQTSLLHSRFPVEYNQLEISLLCLDPFHNGQLDQCMQEKIIPMAWSPLGGGGLFADITDEKNKRIVTVAEKLATKYSTSVDNILLAFLHRHPSGIIPVLGTSKFERIRSAMQAAGIRLQAEEWFMLWEASTGNEVP
jgi:predicted oxidoreductase